jgi:pimeloyl-ACP methyl ester carboxylesterase
MFPAGVSGLRVEQERLRDGLTLRVVEAGAPDAPPTLLVHGWGASLYMWRAWFAPLAQAGRRAVAIDLPGHGLSDKPVGVGHYTLDALTRVLAELIERRRLAGADVVAQSMGGTIALEVALRGAAGIGGVALVNPACFGRVHVLRLARLASPRVVEPLLERLTPRWLVARAHRVVYGDPARLTASDVDEYWAPSGLPGYVHAMRRLVHEFTWERPPATVLAARLRHLRPPTAPPLVVLGTRDRLVRDARPYVDALRDAGAPLQLFESAGCGHAANEECPESVLAACLRHFRGRDGLHSTTTTGSG